MCLESMVALYQTCYALYQNPTGIYHQINHWSISCICYVYHFAKYQFLDEKLTIWVVYMPSLSSNWSLASVLTLLIFQCNKPSHPWRISNINRIVRLCGSLLNHLVICAQHEETTFIHGCQCLMWDMLG